MATKYKLPYTGDEISGKLEKVDNIMNQIIDPDNYPLDVSTESSTTIILEVGKLSRTYGSEENDDGGLRTPDFIPMDDSRDICPVFDQDSLGKGCFLFYDSSYTFITEWNEGHNYKYINSGGTYSEAPGNAAFFRAYFSTDLTEGTMTLIGRATPTATYAEHGKIYFKDSGYYIEGATVDDETMHKLTIGTSGLDNNEYNIIEFRAPENDPCEATLCLMNSGGDKLQFVDFSSMIYDVDNPTTEIVCQTRGDRLLPEFSVRYNNGQGAGRVKKFTIAPDCIPIKLTSTGIEVRRNNNYDNDATEEELVTVNLADLYDKVNVIYDALVANGTITE